MPTTTYDTPKRARYSIDGKFSYPVAVLGERNNYGRTDYRIALMEDLSVSQYVTASRLTFTPEEA